MAYVASPHVRPAFAMPGFAQALGRIYGMGVSRLFGTRGPRRAFNPQSPNAVAPLETEGPKERLEDESSLRAVLETLRLEPGQAVSTALVARYVVDLDLLKQILAQDQA